MTFIELFSKARTHPSIFTDFYDKLNCKYLLILHFIGDGERQPLLQALTIGGFERWMLLQVLLNPDEEYRRLTAFLQAPKRRQTHRDPIRTPKKSSREGSARKCLAEMDWEIEWLKKRLAETQAELDGSWNEVQGLNRLNSARTGSVSLVSSAGTPPYSAGGVQGVKPRYPVCATPESLLGPGTPAAVFSHGTPY
ncbi:hypothetical protein B9Z19DRAFT_1117505 [Tuber borchii]|uniref:DUF7514 domain-containing protein n=1 Tax=Tuber borchii TaxID=42251 RepID=A0A2T6ZC61_TUBBO|nr:hypothetical protein B9Z19DRAFT_1117505 [Tuber borchii]